MKKLLWKNSEITVDHSMASDGDEYTDLHPFYDPGSKPCELFFIIHLVSKR